MAADMKELGSTGIIRSGGYVLEEPLRELQGIRWYKIVKEMRNDPVVGGVLLAIELSLRQVNVEVKPKDDTPAAAEIAQFFTECIGDMSMSWADTLSEILTMLDYGWEYNEIVYKRRMGDNKNSGKSSKYSDGRIGWRKWAPRSQDSLERWEFDEEGGLQGMWQYQWYTGDPTVLIPIDKALLFRTTSRKNSPEGRSILRSSYSPYYYKKNLSRIEAIGLERGLNGVPLAYVPPNLLSSAASDGEKALYASIKEIVANLRTDEQAGVVFPAQWDDKGNRLYELTLLTTQKNSDVSTDTAITRYNQHIAIAMLADFIMLGHDGVGSYALSATKASMFKTALEAFLQAIADVINSYAIPRLARLNGMDMELLPCLSFGKVGEIELTDITEFLKAAQLAGMQMFPDMALENHLRTQLGFPPLDEEQYTEREAKAQAQADAIAGRTQPQDNGQQQDGKQQNSQMSRDEVQAFGEAALRIVARGA